MLKGMSGGIGEAPKGRQMNQGVGLESEEVTWGTQLPTAKVNCLWLHFKKCLLSYYYVLSSVFMAVDIHTSVAFKSLTGWQRN